MSVEMCRYSLEWRLPHVPCPGESVLIAVDVPAGSPVPAEVMALWKPGAGYAVCWNSLTVKPIRRWSAEAKGAARKRNLRRRLEKKMPLFADMLAEEEIARRPAYFAGE
ncbi:theronine dehydrogenase [Rhizobium sp. AC44/96]|uniref:theronine dehydrogenase n=1 Tax=Rhizobium sp. AC44/96 TaxID=1841654 RepID=UPI001FCDAB03|nr:theronine dehydrogenase [Rhizobium sp. AC44/96]